MSPPPTDGSQDRRPRRASNDRGSGSGRRKSGHGDGARSGAPGTSGGSSRDASRKGRDSRGGAASSGEGRDRGKDRGGSRARTRDQRSRGSGATSRRDLRGAAADLPRWVVDDLARVTPNQRVAAALEELGEATAAFTAGKFSRALRHAQRAKDLAPRDTTVREVLGLSAYRVGDWRLALRELRTYRRLSGETTHLPVEMDTLRAEGRHEDVDKAWQQLQDLGASPAVLKEGQVVYGSHLLDLGRIAEARALVTPRTLTPKARDEDLRLWYVAARAAALDHDIEAARRLRNAILERDPSFPGIDELERAIASAG